MAGFGCRVTSRTKYQSSVTHKAVVKELFIYLFILGFVQSSTGAKTTGHKSPTRFKLQPNPLLK